MLEKIQIHLRPDCLVTIVRGFHQMTATFTGSYNGYLVMEIEGIDYLIHTSEISSFGSDRLMQPYLVILPDAPMILQREM